MIITKIKLNNFGIFRGIANFDFDVIDQGRNVILIGGKNGSGKTTILDAIKIALYGPLALGYKTQNATYYEYIYDYLNTFALNNKEDEYAITVNFKIKASGNVDIYEVKRSWEYSGSNIREFFHVTKNNVPLDPKEILDFSNFLRKFIPPDLFNFFFFDGEKIQQYIIDQQFETNVKKTIFTLFNLDLFDLVSKDIQAYLNQENVFKTLSQEQQIITKLEKDKEYLFEEFQQAQEEVDETERLIEDHKSHIRDLENEFRVHGGLLAEEKENFQKEISKLEQEKRLTIDWTKETIGSLLPFLMLKESFQEIKEQIEIEDELINYEAITNKLNRNILTKILISTYEEVDKIAINKNFIDKAVELIYNEIKPSIDIERFQPIHKLSPDEKMEVLSLVSQAECFNGKQLINAFNTVAEKNKRILNLRKKIEHSVADSDLHEVFKKTREISEEIEKLSIKREKISQNKINLEEQITSAEDELMKCKSRVLQARKDENIYTISNRINNVAKRFLQMQSEMKTELIKRNFQQIFSQLLRKEDFIKEVSIKDDLTNIRMINKLGYEVKKSSLSAGEKQIYILSLLYALIKTSRREIPLVFDTLLGRLDHSHKEKIICKFLPQSSCQTIVLSTDTEIDEKYYQKLKPYIAREYLINFDESQNKVNIEQKYFF